MDVRSSSISIEDNYGEEMIVEKNKKKNGGKNKANVLTRQGINMGINKKPLVDEGLKEYYSLKEEKEEEME